MVNALRWVGSIIVIVAYVFVVREVFANMEYLRFMVMMMFMTMITGGLVISIAKHKTLLERLGSLIFFGGLIIPIVNIVIIAIIFAYKLFN